MSIFGKIFRSRDRPKDLSLSSTDGWIFAPSDTGEVVTPLTALQTSGVYACVQVIAQSIATLPCHLYRRREDGGEEIARDNPLDYILHDQPNPEMTAYSFYETLTAQIALWGNAYAQIIRDGAGRIVELYPLQAAKMQVLRDNAGELYYQYTQSGDSKNPGKVVNLRPAEVLHVPGMGYNGIVGFSPITIARRSIGMTIAAEKYGGNFYKNGARPSGALEYPGQLKDPEKVRKSWNAVYGGSDNSGKVVILEEGMKYTPIAMSMADAQFIENRKYQLNDIARIYRIPPHMIGDLEKATFSNIEHQSLEFVKYTLAPWVQRWEQAMKRCLLTQKEKTEYSMRMNVDGLLRGDYQSRMNGYAVARQNGWMNANEIRALENMNHIPAELGGDDYLINGNMIKITDAGGDKT